ncbi:hypothetical protein [Tumebacillus permanentifrigoris]|uniref:Uncharacterized protein n=1 Tax=Tumebacillus permanentifrigoris TaxID=378543 RepID=A0A316D4F4_9BACL|nr:hypothetical protein [Tumebacillus permanentifrigoris]PWK05312.1 hypothetical protein C7459_12461 [Tumebacillus permanentifrigoris]
MGQLSELMQRHWEQRNQDLDNFRANCAKAREEIREINRQMQEQRERFLRESRMR